MQETQTESRYHDEGLPSGSQIGSCHAVSIPLSDRFLRRSIVVGHRWLSQRSGQTTQEGRRIGRVRYSRRSLVPPATIPVRGSQGEVGDRKSTRLNSSHLG